MVQEFRDRAEIERARFKGSMIAAHPEHSQVIERVFSDKDPDAELSAEESEYFEMDTETEAVVDDLRRMGFSVRPA